MIVDVTYKMPTEWIGVEWTEEFFFDFDEDMTEEERRNEIEDDLSNWVTEILNDLRMNAEYEVKGRLI